MTYLFCLMFTLFKYKVQGIADCRTRGGYVYYCLSFVADTLTVNSRVDKLNLLKTVAFGMRLFAIFCYFRWVLKCWEFVVFSITCLDIRQFRGFFYSFVSLHQMTYLHLAFEGGHMNTVKYLVDKRADINTKYHRGVCVWTYSTKNRFFENKNLLVQGLLLY